MIDAMKPTDWIVAPAASLAAVATVYYAWLTRKLLEVQTTPAVTLDLDAGRVANTDEPLNFALVRNHGPGAIIEVALLAEPHGSVPFFIHYWPEIIRQNSERWSIDEALDKMLSNLGIDLEHPPSDSTPVFHLHLKYRRKSDGRPFREQIRCRIIVREGQRPFAVLRGPEALLD
jgi:hypothetical protein